MSEDPDLQVEQLEEVVDHDQPSVESDDIRVKNYLGLQDVSNKDSDRLRVVSEWVKAQADDNIDSSGLWALKQLEARLAAPKVGQSRLDVLYQYVKLNNTAKRAEQERDLLTR